MSKNNGGPAFPLADPNMINPMSVAEYEQAAHGMSMRDYFAAKAMQSLLARYGHQAGELDELARNAYDCADAMLAERAK